MKCVEQLNKKYYIHSSILQQIPPERAKSFPLVTNAAHRTPIPQWWVNHCGGTAVHTPCSLSHLNSPRGCLARSVFQAVRDLGVVCCLFLVSSLFYSNYNNQKYTCSSQLFVTATTGHFNTFYGLLCFKRKFDQKSMFCIKLWPMLIVRTATVW